MDTGTERRDEHDRHRIRSANPDEEGRALCYFSLSKDMPRSVAHLAFLLSDQGRPRCIPHGDLRH